MSFFERSISLILCSSSSPKWQSFWLVIFNNICTVCRASALESLSRHALKKGCLLRTFFKGVHDSGFSSLHFVFANSRAKATSFAFEVDSMDAWHGASSPDWQDIFCSCLQLVKREINTNGKIVYFVECVLMKNIPFQF